MTYPTLQGAGTCVVISWPGTVTVKPGVVTGGMGVVPQPDAISVPGIVTPGTWIEPPSVIVVKVTVAPLILSNTVAGYLTKYFDSDVTLSIRPKLSPAIKPIGY